MQFMVFAQWSSGMSGIFLFLLQSQSAVFDSQSQSCLSEAVPGPDGEESWTAVVVWRDGHPDYDSTLPLCWELGSLVKDVAEDSTAQFAFTKMEEVPWLTELPAAGLLHSYPSHSVDKKKSSFSTQSCCNPAVSPDLPGHPVWEALCALCTLSSQWSFPPGHPGSWLAFQMLQRVPQSWGTSSHPGVLPGCPGLLLESLSKSFVTRDRRVTCCVKGRYSRWQWPWGNMPF